MGDLNSKFQKAYSISSAIKKKLPPDIMLKLYAYYKQATIDNDYYEPSGENQIRNAFKLNALLQAGNINQEEAKKLYIKLVENITKQKID